MNISRKNYSASVLARLLNHSRENKQDYQFLLTQKSQLIDYATHSNLLASIGGTVEINASTIFLCSSSERVKASVTA
jgi:hypothetical protein